MTHKKSHLILSICVCLTLPSLSASAQPKSKSWLDRPLQNWNRGDDGFPKLPRATVGIEMVNKRCLDQVRPPTIPAEQALVRQGWKLYGSVQSYGLTQVITATSGFDGMCRPVQYQAFVYWEGRYAGTLSPVSMDSRTDGSIANINLTSTTNISAEFNRYSSSDALCCPSGKSWVQFNLRPDDLPDLRPVSVSSGEIRQICPNREPQAEVDSNSKTIWGKKWKLVEMSDRPVKASEAYIEFDRQQQRFSGSGGCNRIAGGFKVEGSKLKFSQTISTKKACPNDNVETTFLRLLETTTRFEVEADKLRLFDRDRQILVFSK